MGCVCLWACDLVLEAFDLLCVKIDLHESGHVVLDEGIFNGLVELSHALKVVFIHHML